MPLRFYAPLISEPLMHSQVISQMIHHELKTFTMRREWNSNDHRCACRLFQKCWERIRAKKNCFLDSSRSYLNASLVRITVTALGPDKVIFGSDGAHGLRNRGGGGHSYESILQRTLRIPIPDKDKEDILHKNLEKSLP